MTGVINVGAEEITSLFVGEMGIKTACVGDAQIYNRTSSYVYIQLTTENTEGANANG